jgi:phage-related protein (TIGR01555 family)
MPDPVDLRTASATRNPVRRIHPDILAAARTLRSRPSLDNWNRNPFAFPSFPPQVERAVAEAFKANPEGNVRPLAMDAEAGGTFGWAASDPLHVQYSEGVAFLGYSYLATLAQRAEYRVVTETIAAEATREWIELKVASGDESKNDLKNFIEDRMDELKVQDAFRQVSEGDGFFGRAHLYLDTGVTDDAEELISDIGNGRSVLSQLKVGPNKNQKLIRLQPVEPTWVYPTFYESVDPLKRNWYNPVNWYVMSREIHRSRLLTFVSRPVPDILKPAYSFGGLAMTQMLKPYVDNWLRTRQSVSDLVVAFSHNVLRTNLDATTGAGGQALMDRISMFNNIKNNQGTLVIDKDSEDWSNVSIPVGSLDHLQAQAQEHMAAVSRIPLVKLLGIQPAGLNATSEGELIAFEDWIASYQEVLFRDALRTVIDFIQLSAFGRIDEDIDFEFKPLRQLKPIEEAQLQSVVAQTRESYLSVGAVDANEVREALAEDKESPFGGLDLSRPLPEPPGMPGMPGAPEMGMPGEGPSGASPGAPGGPSRPPHLPQPPQPPMPSPGRPSDGFPTDEEFGEEVEAIPMYVEPVGLDAKPRLKRPRG